MTWLSRTKKCWKSKVVFIDTDSLILYIKTDDIYSDIAVSVKIRFNTSNYEL